MAMGTREKNTGNVVFAGIVCLAVGLAVGYYYGKSAGSSQGAPGAVTPGQGTSSMDQATFRQNEANLKFAIGSNPKDLESIIQLGNLYYDNSKFKDAVDWYGKALEIDPSNVNVRTDRGSAYWSLGQADAAIGEFQKSLQVNPTHAQTLFNLGIVYLHGKNDMDAARKAWEKLLATNPDYPDRARLQGMLGSVGGTAASPTSPPAASGQTGQGKAGSGAMDDLFKRMKK